MAARRPFDQEAFMNEPRLPPHLLRALRATAVVALALLLAVAWAEREVTVAITSDPLSMDPHVAATTQTVTTVNHIFDNLVQRHPVTMAIVPNLATSWEISEDRIYEFTLREGVRFHNGDLLTSEDVVFSFDRMLQPGFENLGNYVRPIIESVEALDELTVRITLLAPYAPFLNRLPTFYIVPAAYIREVGDEAVRTRADRDRPLPLRRMGPRRVLDVRGVRGPLGR
jgi:peptide/nickel transport system substrate-binding protein